MQFATAEILQLCIEFNGRVARVFRVGTIFLRGTEVARKTDFRQPHKYSFPAKLSVEAVVKTPPSMSPITIAHTFSSK